MKKMVIEGTVRIQAKDFKVYEKTKTSWKRSKLIFPGALEVVKLFKANRKLNHLIDKKDSRWLKGQLSPDGLQQGARINILPNGEVLEKAYSLLAPELTINDEDSDDNWDVIYRNYGGTYSYVYTLKKRAQARNKKYRRVNDFAKLHSKLKRNVSIALKDKEDEMAMPMYTLLKTYMRVGNEIYYKANKHKGLTTLKKKDITIKRNLVTFDYLGKCGVPVRITQEFPGIYVKRLKVILKDCKPSSFVFTNSNGKPIDERHFKKAFLKYCGQEFYPHVVRSYFATSEVKKYLTKVKDLNKNKTREFLLSLAASLGHKRYVKKDKEWKESYAVTLNSYVAPVLIKKIKKYF